MKALFILVIASLVILNTINAQRIQTVGDREAFFRVGAKGGLNINKIKGQSYKDGYNFNYQLGGFAQLNFSRTFGLQPEINFVQGSSEFTNDAGNIYNDLFRDGGQKKAKLNYLEIPVLLNVNVGPTKRVKLQLGPAYGNVLKQSVDSLQSGGDIFKNAEWSGIAGLWLQLPLINLSARYKIGFTDLNNIDNRDSWKSQAIQLGIGVTL